MHSLSPCRPLFKCFSETTITVAFVRDAFVHKQDLGYHLRIDIKALLKSVKNSKHEYYVYVITEVKLIITEDSFLIHLPSHL